MSQSLAKETNVINGRFQLIKRLGAGSFGEIFEVLDLKSKRSFACKAEPKQTKHPQLQQEFEIYQKLRHSENFLRVYAIINHGRFKLMIMDKLGCSLEMLFNYCKRRFSIKTVCLIAIQLISRIEELHKHGWLHRDIKPDNFLIGSYDKHGTHSGILYMIDLGLGKEWLENGSHIQHKQGKRLIGTPRYASINTHFGHEQSRRDDLESLGYMLMYFVKGILPWQGLRGHTKEQKYKKIGSTKRNTNLSELCNGYPIEFSKYISDCRQLAFDETPNYDKYKSYFKNVMLSLGYDYNNEKDRLFDWQLDMKSAQSIPAVLRFPQRHSLLRNNNNNNNNNSNNNIIKNNNNINNNINNFNNNNNKNNNSKNLLDTKNIINSYKQLELDRNTIKRKNQMLIAENIKLKNAIQEYKNNSNIQQNEIIKFKNLYQQEMKQIAENRQMYNNILNKHNYLNSELNIKNSLIKQLKQQLYQYKNTNQQLNIQLNNIQQSINNNSLQQQFNMSNQQQQQYNISNMSNMSNISNMANMSMSNIANMSSLNNNQSYMDNNLHQTQQTYMETPNNINNINNNNIIGTKRRRLIPKVNIHRKRQKMNSGGYMTNDTQIDLTRHI